MSLPALLLAAALNLAAERTSLPYLGRCTIVAVKMMDNVDSSDARPGDFFRFETLNAVTSGKKIIIPERTMGYGIVVIASPAGSQGRSGTLVLEPRYLVLPSGTKLGVVLDHDVSDLQRSGTSGSMPGYLGAVPVPGIGAAIGIFNYFHHGRNILVKKGTIFEIFPSDDPATETCQQPSNS
ncbi:MAG TPA: hypothetical protein VGZ02_07115 [Candidatus Baltobacteraceae bacterium]|nr:hypothetical protein [Candidatus Baltobacteraceae bacterium]